MTEQPTTTNAQRLRKYGKGVKTDLKETRPPCLTSSSGSIILKH
jgi:hypothetical protein